MIMTESELKDAITNCSYHIHDIEEKIDELNAQTSDMQTAIAEMHLAAEDWEHRLDYYSDLLDEIQS